MPSVFLFSHCLLSVSDQRPVLDFFCSASTHEQCEARAPSQTQSVLPGCQTTNLGSSSYLPNIQFSLCNVEHMLLHSLIEPVWSHSLNSASLVSTVMVVESLSIFLLHSKD